VFPGKIIAATHRDIHQSMGQGDFRKDFYYRLCSDIITTPSLHQQILEAPDVLGDLVLYIAQRVAGPEGETIADEVLSWIHNKLGLEYLWPGNIRELEQCVRSVMIRREYRPVSNQIHDQDERMTISFREGILSLEEICRLYCTHIYASVGSYVETARRLKIDRRTVKKYVAQ
jgi:transcriptional regulator with PAS, ATPase and Fis domain